MTPKGLLDLADETLVAIAQHLVLPSDLAPIAPISDVTDITCRPSRILTGNSGIVAFMSTCKRTRHAVQPFGLSCKLYIEEKQKPKPALRRVPVRFLKGISRLYLICALEDRASRRHSATPAHTCVGHYARQVLPFVPNLVTLALVTFALFQDAVNRCHRCKIATNQPVKLNSLESLLIDHQAAQCLSTSPPWLFAPSLHTLRIDHASFRLRNQEVPMVWSKLASNSGFDFSKLRSLQLPLQEFSGGQRRELSWSKVIAVAVKHPDLREFGVTTLLPSALSALVVSCDSTDGTWRLSLTEQGKQLLSGLSAFANLERLNPFVHVTAELDPATMPPRPQAAAPAAIHLAELGEKIARYAEAEREGLRQVVAFVAAGLRESCPTLQSGGLWVSNVDHARRSWWWEWKVVQEEKVESIRVARFGVPDDERS